MAALHETAANNGCRDFRLPNWAPPGGLAESSLRVQGRARFAFHQIVVTPTARRQRIGLRLFAEVLALARAPRSNLPSIVPRDHLDRIASVRMQRSDGLWIGGSGTPGSQVDARRRALRRTAASQSLRRAWASPRS